MDCIFCKEIGETTEAVALAPQLAVHRSFVWEFSPVCASHLVEWWDGSDVEPDERPGIVAIDGHHVCPDCGSTDLQGPDDEGVRDCLGCGVFFTTDAYREVSAPRGGKNL